MTASRWIVMIALTVAGVGPAAAGPPLVHAPAPARAARSTPLTAPAEDAKDRGDKDKNEPSCASVEKKLVLAGANRTQVVLTAAERALVLGTCLPDTFNIQFTGLGSDVLQAIGQAVVKKAIRAGWTELEDKLVELAKCDKSDALAQTCKVLRQARIEDLIASPRTLLDAFAADVFTDLLHNLDAKFKAGVGLEAVAALAASWIAVGQHAMQLHAVPWIQARFTHAAFAGPVTGAQPAEASQPAPLDLGGCPATEDAAVAWVLAKCYLESPSFAGCDPNKEVASCPFQAGNAEVARVAEIGVSALVSKDDNRKDTAELVTRLFFEWLKLADPSDKDLLDALETMFIGLVDRDWTRTVIGIGHLATASKIDMKLVRIVGAVGQFAETYGNGVQDPTAARGQVIEDLVTSLVDRAERDHGAVISLGGALGLLGGVRLNDNGQQVAVPIRLTLGLGLDTYGGGKQGFHATLDAFDLGQYITYSSGSLDVGSPDVKSVLIVGATGGYWFGNRNTPMFVGLHGSVSPFVRTMDNKMTYEVGAMFGVYVPLLDFN